MATIQTNWKAHTAPHFAAEWGNYHSNDSYRTVADYTSSDWRKPDQNSAAYTVPQTDYSPVAVAAQKHSYSDCHRGSAAAQTCSDSDCRRWCCVVSRVGRLFLGISGVLDGLRRSLLMRWQWRWWVLSPNCRRGNRRWGGGCHLCRLARRSLWKLCLWEREKITEKITLKSIFFCCNLAKQKENTKFN